MKKFIIFAAAALAFPFFFAKPAAAQTAQLTVTATVLDACEVTSGTLDFGTYDPLSGQAVTGSGTFTVTCTKDTPATIVLDQGMNPDSGSTDDNPLRRMASGTNYLSYALYSDSNGVNVWGNTAATGVAFIGTGTPETFTVYGVIPASQNVPAGQYTDTVTIQVTF